MRPWVAGHQRALLIRLTDRPRSEWRKRTWRQVDAVVGEGSALKLLGETEVPREGVVAAEAQDLPVAMLEAVVAEAQQGMRRR